MTILGPIARARGLALILFVLFVAALAGCTTTTIEPEFVQKPTKTYTEVAVGDVTAANKLWQLYLPYFREALILRLKEKKAFTHVLDPAPANPAPTSFVVTGVITEFDKGSAAARFLIGFGAGRARVRGKFEIHGADGALLAKFESGKAYSGGAGIGGFDMVSMDDLMEKFGVETADAIIQWSRGNALDEPLED